MGKKNLEQLFREVFKDYSETPDDKVWKVIEASLDKKEQKKRVIPIWWKLGGVAAALAILFYAIDPFNGSNENGNITVTETQNNNTTDDGSDIEQIQRSEQLVESSKDKNPQSNEGSSQNSEETIIENHSIESEQQLVSTPTIKQKENETANINKGHEKKWDVVKNEENNIVTAHTEVQKNADGDTGEKNILSNETEAVTLSSENTDQKNQINNTDVEAGITKDKGLFDTLDTENAIAESQTDEPKAIEKESVAQHQDSENTPEKKSIFEVIEEKEEEAVAENDSSSKWSVGPSVAPVYFGSTGEGSPIHSIFSTNSKTGKVNLSYGLTVAYNIAKKLKVRSGVHKVDYGYNTNNVVFSASLDASANQKIDNIDYRQASRTIVVQSQENIPLPTANDALVELAANENPSFDGKMIQQLGYIEVPLELDYALIDKKFGVNLIGGVSSLFLVDNSVLLESEDLITEVGEANNANAVNFSTNIGIGLNYEFSPKVQLNLEPVFKYQLNTFSDTAGSFRPFSVGVYSGIRFKF